MKFFTSNLLKLKVVLLLIIASTSSVFAGTVVPVPAGDITFSMGGATAVPTLSGVMLIVLSLLLFLVAFRIAKQKNTNAGKFFMMLLGIGALGLGGSGIQLVNDVKAGIDVPIGITPIEGGPIPEIPNTPIDFAPGAIISTESLENFVAVHFQNQSSSAQIIKVEAAGPREGFVCDYYEEVQPEGILDCLTLPSLAPGQICGIGCRSIEPIVIEDILDSDILSRPLAKKVWE